MLKTIIGVYPKSLTGSSGKLNDEIIMEMVNDISKSLVSIIDLDRAHFTILRTDDKGRLPSLSTVLLQEIESFNKLLEVIHGSLNDLCKAIKGLVVMSTELEGVYTSFMNNTVIHLFSIYFSIKNIFLQ